MAVEARSATLVAPSVKNDAQDPVYLRIRDLVYQTCGIYHSEEKLYLLVGACKRRMEKGKAGTAREYLELLTGSAYREAESRELLNEITIGETCLFRSQPLLNALQNVILPEIIKERAKMGLKKLKVWSAGCSTGEEPYTLAMFLTEQQQKLLKEWSFEISATDLNDRSIETAKSGIYGDYALRNTTDLYKRKYFLPADSGKLKVTDELKRKITFTRLNLNDDSRMLFMKGMDLILCCNVLIYFEHGDLIMSIRLNPDLMPTLLAAIQQSAQNESTTTTEMSSGESVNQLSDNPAAAAALVLNHDQTDQAAQYLQNLSTLQGKYQVADSALSNVVEALTSALSLGTEGANGTVNDSERQAIAQQVQGLLTQTVSLANTAYQGSYLFSGTKVTTEPFTLDSTTNTVTYNGNTSTTSVELSDGNSITANVPGTQIFQNADGSAIGALQDLYTALTSGNNIGAAVTEVQNGLNQISSQRVFYGNAMNQITDSESFLNQEKLNLSQQETSLVGADMAQVTSEFSQAQVANEATLGATAKVLGMHTLLDYLV
jgi:chemotaxis methyl-accepting protein methylase/flagellin-like hook-associated protein FlgL